MAAIFSLAAVLGVALALLWGLAVWAYARMLMSPPRMTDGKAAYRLRRVSPMDVGMAFEDFAVEVRGGKDGERLKIAAWMIAAEGSDRLAVLVHGYADAKVGALAWAPVFRELGYHVVLCDLRAHGESGGEMTTAGVREAEDLDQFLDAVRERYPGRCREVVLFGASLGAAAVAKVATRRGDVQAVVLDSPVPTFLDGALAHAELLALPGRVVVGPAVWLGERWAGVRFEEAAVTRTLGEMRCPAMVVAPGEDDFLTEESRGRLRAAFDEHERKYPGAVWWEPDVPHLLGVVYEGDAYRERLVGFLGR